MPPAQDRARGRLRFSPGWQSTLATVLLLPLLLALGQWQLGRADAKDARRAALAQQGRRPELVLDGSAPWPAADDLAFRRLQVRGRYDAAHQMLLDNQVQDGQAGYHVITPLTLAGSTRQILVNRGWVPAPADRRLIPQVPVPQGPVLARGFGQPPWRSAWLLAPEPASLENKNWRGVWQYITPERYAAARRQEPAEPAPEVAPAVLILTSEATLATDDVRGTGPTGAPAAAADAAASAQVAAGGDLPAPLPAGAASPPQPRRVAPLPPDDGAARNRAYAGQWFAFAATLVALYVGLNLRRRP